MFYFEETEPQYTVETVKHPTLGWVEAIHFDPGYLTPPEIERVKEAWPYSHEFYWNGRGTLWDVSIDEVFHLLA